MTIKKLTLSVVAATMIATTGFSATIHSGSTDTISSELLSVQAVPVQVSKPIVFTCNMNKTSVATASQAGVQLTIPGLDSTNNTKQDVYELKNMGTKTNPSWIVVKVVATQGSVIPSKNMIVFNGENNTSIVEGKVYGIGDQDLNVSADANTSLTTTTGAITFNVAQGSSSVPATVQVVSNDGVSVLDVGSAPIATAVKQYALKVMRQASAQIDSTNGFFDFRTNSNTDTIKFRLYNNANLTDAKADGLSAVIDIPATTTKSTAVLSWDQNLTAYKITPAVSVGTYVQQPGPYDTNATYIISKLGTTGANATVTFTKKNNNAQPMSTTNFTLSGNVLFNGIVKPLKLATNLNAGSWTIYGYNAQVPNVRNNANLTTYVNITNTSSIPAEAIFKIIPETDGVNAGVGSCTIPAGIIPANASRKFNIANVLAKSNCSPAVKTDSNMAVEITVPTSPTQVFANAYTKNKQLNSFITLPVYSNGTANKD